MQRVGITLCLDLVTTVLGGGKVTSSDLCTWIDEMLCCEVVHMNKCLDIIWKRPVIAEQNCIIDACGKLFNCRRKYRLYCCCWEDMKLLGRWGKMIGKWCKPDLNLRCLHESQCIGTYFLLSYFALTTRHWPSWIHFMWYIYFWIYLNIIIRYMVAPAICVVLL